LIAMRSALVVSLARNATATFANSPSIRN
jgi:hypothetical protein